MSAARRRGDARARVVMLLSNARFEAEDGDDGEHARLVRPEVVERCSSLLGTDALAPIVLTRTIKVSAAEIVIELSPPQAEAARDALGRAVYCLLFDWLVKAVNAYISGGAADGELGWVGLLDIFGFEDFEVNSFEQLCINFANEKLQPFFLQTHFKARRRATTMGEHQRRVSAAGNAPDARVVDAAPSLLALLAHMRPRRRCHAATRNTPTLTTPQAYRRPPPPQYPPRNTAAQYQGRHVLARPPYHHRLAPSRRSSAAAARASSSWANSPRSRRCGSRGGTGGGGGAGRRRRSRRAAAEAAAAVRLMEAARGCGKGGVWDRARRVTGALADGAWRHTGAAGRRRGTAPELPRRRRYVAAKVGAPWALLFALTRTSVQYNYSFPVCHVCRAC